MSQSRRGGRTREDARRRGDAEPAPECGRHSVSGAIEGERNPRDRVGENADPRRRPPASLRAVSRSIGPYPSRVAGVSSRPRRVREGTVTTTVGRPEPDAFESPAVGAGAAAGRSATDPPASRSASASALSCASVRSSPSAVARCRAARSRRVMAACALSAGSKAVSVAMPSSSAVSHTPRSRAARRCRSSIDSAWTFSRSARAAVSKLDGVRRSARSVAPVSNAVQARGHRGGSRRAGRS